jgi:hypothetical protein
MALLLSTLAQAGLEVGQVSIQPRLPLQLGKAGLDDIQGWWGGR